MNQATKSYVSGRFADFYRQSDPYYPPEIEARELAYIPFTESEETVMVRHNTNHSIGNIGDFLEDTPPRHTYYSAAYYNDPGRKGGMSNKGWEGADLIFDIDCDHLTESDDGLSKKEALNNAKNHLKRLIKYIKEDFNFNDITVVFSGNRGYHLHVRDPEISMLGGKEREEIANYLQAHHLDISSTIKTSYENGSKSRRIGEGWGKHLFNSFQRFIETTIQNKEKESAIDALIEFDNIGEGRAEKIYSIITNQNHTLNIENVAVRTLYKQYAKENLSNHSVDIDAPVTTDTHRLIRYPGTIHGGSGLLTTLVNADEVDDFSPLTDAIPERFIGQDITIKSNESYNLYLNGREHTIPKGESTVPEFLGIHLMLTNKAEKATIL